MYFDPGFGSMIIQWVLAGAAFIGIVFAAMWSRISGWFGWGRKKNAPPAMDEVDDDFEKVDEDD